jgi:hypothetical protein
LVTLSVMQIYLFQNGKQEGPFGLPRIAARLVSGDLDSATPAWREGMDSWYPLNHPVWAEAGIVAPPSNAAEDPVEEVAPASESEPPAEVSVAPEEQGEVEAVPPEEELTPNASEVVIAETEVEQPSHAFANYREDDFKPPSYDEMEGEMVQLRAKRETFPELIGRQAFESGLRDEEIEEAWVEVEKMMAGGSEERLPGAFAELGRALMAAGITDPALDDLREEEQETSDRMLNLQMQLRRMGGGGRVKKTSPWRKWIVLSVVLLFFGGTVTALVLFGKN